MLLQSLEKQSVSLCFEGNRAGRGSLCKSLSPGNKLTVEANDLAPESKWVLCQELKDK